MDFASSARRHQAEDRFEDADVLHAIEHALYVGDDVTSGVAVPEPRSYGTSRSGIELSEAVTERMADEAEAGLDIARQRRRPGRPSMGAEPAKALPVRFEPELRWAIEERATSEGVTAAEVVRRALREYLRSA